MFADDGLVFDCQLGKRYGRILRAGAFLVDSVHQAPIARFHKSHFQAASHPGKAVAHEAIIEMRGGGGEHGLRTALCAHVEQCLNRADTLTAAPRLALDNFPARDAGG